MKKTKKGVSKDTPSYHSGPTWALTKDSLIMSQVL